jgi:alkyl sulfatase BDS1-like metallo-beta-lactamase superfamily hydrolase
MEELQHFDPKGKMPSKFTIELQKGFRDTLHFEDKRDFEEAKRSFVGAPSYTTSWPRPSAWLGMWAATNSRCKATTLTLFTLRCSVRRS